MDQKNHNRQMDFTRCREGKDNIQVQQQSSDTVQHELTAGYLSQKFVVYPAAP